MPILCLGVTLIWHYTRKLKTFLEVAAQPQMALVLPLALNQCPNWVPFAIDPPP